MTAGVEEPTTPPPGGIGIVRRDYTARPVPTPCPVCGAYSLAPDVRTSALLAVCDVLVLKALETLGKFLVRAERSRYRTLGTRPWHVAHTLWQPDDSQVARALKSAWDVVPAMVDTHGFGLSPVRIVTMLDDYVHDLAVTGTAHDIEELRYRFEAHLGLPVYTTGTHDEG